MKKKLFSFLITFFCALTLVNISTVSEGNITAAKAARATTYHRPLADSLKTRFFKKLLNAFKLSANAKSARQKELVENLRKIIVNDSMVLTKKDLQALTKKLNDQKTTYDSLINSLKTIETHPPKFKTAKDSDIAAKDTLNADAIIDEITNRIIPLISAKDDSGNTSRKQDNTLNLLRTIPADARDPGSAVTHVKNADSGTTYKVMLKYKAEVFAFHSYKMNDKYMNYNFMSINTLAYNGYDLDGRNGGYKSIHGWDSAIVIDKAKAAGCRVVLTVNDKDQKDISKFLASKKSEQAFIANILKLLSDRKGQGININFKNLSNKDSKHFNDFVALLARQLRSADTTYQLTVNVPAFDDKTAYDVASLSSWVDKFIILNYDFEDGHKKGQAAPIAPLGETYDNSLEISLTKYVNRGVVSGKFILSVPYYAAKWKLGSGTNGDLFKNYMKYGTVKDLLKNKYPNYEKEIAAKNIDLSADSTGNAVIWYDDPQTLGQKYDYILQNKLGGVAILALIADDGNTELWNTLTNKFVTLDTIYSRPSAKTGGKKGLGNWFKNLGGYINYYLKVFQHPENYCECEYSLPRYLRIINIILFIVILALAAFFVFSLKNNGDTWKYKTPLAIVMAVLVVLLSLSVLIQFFLSSVIPWFGVSSYNGNEKAVINVHGNYILTKDKTYKDTTLCISLKKIPKASKADSSSNIVAHKYAYTMVADTVELDSMPDVVYNYKRAPGDLAKRGLAFVVNDTSYIIDKATADKKAASPRPTIPLHVFVMIITAGLLVGFLLTRFLLPSIFDKKDVP